MAKKPKIKSLKLAEKFRDLLLYELMGDNIGTKPEHPIPSNTATFAEKKGFYAELLKHAQLDMKLAGDDAPDSFFDQMKRQVKDGSAESGSRRDTGGGESGSDDSSGSDS